MYSKMSYIYLYIKILLQIANQHSYYKLGNALNANKVCQWMPMKKCIADNADPDATWFECKLCWYWFMYHNYILVLYNNTKKL